MNVQHHDLSVSTGYIGTCCQGSTGSVSSGTQRELISLHFGSAEHGKKVYIQASLHADEIPGMLVAHYLRQTLAALDAAGQISAEIVLVPVANPIGLAQEVYGTAVGRFDLANGINFNRGYQYLTPPLIAALDGKLGANADANVQTIRAQALAILQRWQPKNESEQMKKTLQTLAIDADVVLDLHCDNQAVMHLYTGTQLLEATLPLAARLGAQALLVCSASGDNPFDESASRHWWELAQHFGDQIAIPNACLSLTVELRGETEVSHALAIADAAAIIGFLQQAGYIAGTAELCPEQLCPALQCAATPLEGVEPIVAAYAGVLVFSKALGTQIAAGESIGDLLDPATGALTPLLATVSGVLFARVSRRYVRAGTSVAKIAGHQPFRTGNLLSL